MAVLIVDDSENLRAVLADYLAEVGFREIDEAADGLEAVRLIAVKRYECVFLDLYLPGLNGIDVLRTIRAAGNKVPVVVVSTESRDESMRQVFAAGATDYLIKPFGKEAFLQKAKRVLGL